MFKDDSGWVDESIPGVRSLGQSFSRELVSVIEELKAVTRTVIGF